ncbi:MAG: twin-arginine translocase TatA/TatE family subunit [Chloroflexi bacterium]|nr:twin-arginine translocase TatA/TatE family subunit [Chloroflexota bacterium]
MRLGPWEIALILAIILIVFGVGKLPQVGDAMGRAIRNFRKAQTGEADQEEKDKEQTSRAGQEPKAKS